MKDVEWQGNSKQMYEAILKEVPFIFAGKVKRDIADWLAKNGIRTVTEDVVFRAVDEIAPAGLADKRIKPGLEKLRTPAKD